MSYNQILYPSKSKTLEDLVYFSNWALVYPTYQSNPTYLDEEEEKNSLRNNLNEDKWTYFINKYGFRGNWKLDTNKKKIGFFGCSLTLGQGLEEKYTFPHLVEQKYNQKIECLNFGVSGASSQRIAKIISAVLNIADLEVFVITMPPTSRISYIHEVGMLSDLLPGKDFNNKEKSLYSILKQEEFDMYALDSIQWIKAELKNKKILWSSWCPNTYKILKNIIEEEYLLPLFPINSDKARDDKHPGKECNRLYADVITKKIDLLNWTS